MRTPLKVYFRICMNTGLGIALSYHFGRLLFDIDHTIIASEPNLVILVAELSFVLFATGVNVFDYVKRFRGDIR